MHRRRQELALSKAYHNPVNDGSHGIPVNGVAARELRHYHSAPPPTSMPDILKTARRFETAGITGIALAKRVAASHGGDYFWTVAFLRANHFSMVDQPKREPIWVTMARKKNSKANVTMARKKISKINAKSVLHDKNMAKSKAHLDKLIAGMCIRVQHEGY